MAGTTTLASLRILIGADTTGAQRGLAQLGQTVTRTEAVVNKSSVGMNRFGRELAQMGARVAGVDPMLIRLGTSMGKFALGTGIAFAVVAGLDAIRDAFKKLEEQTADYQKTVDDTAKALDDLVRKGAGGTRLELTERIVTARTEKGALERQRPQLEADLREANTFGSKRVQENAQRALDVLDAEIATWERRLRVATEALQEAVVIPLEGITVTVERARRLIGDPFARLRGEREAEVGPRDAAAKAEFEAEAARRRRFLIGYKPERITSPSDGSHLLDGAAGKLEKIFDSFSGKLGEFFKEKLDLDIGGLGAGLAIQFGSQIAGSLIEALKPVDRLTEAMEANTRALSISSEYLTSKLSGAGLSEKGQSAEDAVQMILDRIRAEDYEPGTPGRTFGISRFTNTVDAELAKVGLTRADLTKLAEVLNIDIDPLTEETLQAFHDQLEKATDAVSAFTETLRNVPQIFKVSAARFRASDNDDGLQRRAARGGAPPLLPTYG